MPQRERRAGVRRQVGSVDPDRELFDYNQQNDNCWTERDRASELWAWKGQKDQLKAIDAKTGNVLWEVSVAVAPMTLAVDDQKVCFYDGQSVVALDRQSGQRLWASDWIAAAQKAARAKRRGKATAVPAAQGPATFRTGYGPNIDKGVQKRLNLIYS